MQVLHGWLSVFASMALAFSVSAQEGPPASADEYEKAYQRRIQMDYLYGVYIPSDLTDAFSSLNKLIDKESRQQFRKMPEEEVFRKLFFSLGRWIIHNWGFYGGSRLSHHIRKFGIAHPED
ncbi:MAG: DUF6794 domain-containing protein, partial [Saprospiraceae bacterium]|nr:DUF6794 domain-containing protein [Saprospiraceae bacterium]